MFTQRAKPIWITGNLDNQHPDDDDDDKHLGYSPYSSNALGLINRPFVPHNLIAVQGNPVPC